MVPIATTSVRSGLKSTKRHGSATAKTLAKRKAGFQTNEKNVVSGSSSARKYPA